LTLVLYTEAKSDATLVSLIVSSAASLLHCHKFFKKAPIGVANLLNSCADSHTVCADVLPNSCITDDASQKTTFIAFTLSLNQLARSITFDLICSRKNTIPAHAIAFPILEKESFNHSLSFLTFHILDCISHISAFILISCSIFHCAIACLSCSCAALKETFNLSTSIRASIFSTCFPRFHISLSKDFVSAFMSTNNSQSVVIFIS
jgi:hypothetical protein